MTSLIRFSRRFRRLQWKLTLFYTLTTVLILVLLEILVALVLLGFVTANAIGLLTVQVSTAAQNISSNFTGPFVNRVTLSQALSEWRQRNGTEFQGYIAALDPGWQVLAAAGNTVPGAPSDLRATLPLSVQQHIEQAFAQNPATVNALTTSTYEEKDTAYIVAPMVSEQKIRGVLLVVARHVQFHSNNVWEYLPAFFLYGGSSLVIFFVGAGMIGLVFGVVTARHLGRRIQHILLTARSWGQGDFSPAVHDTSEDELGQLALQLNQMAEQLQGQFETRQALATLQERNRLARELHDSIKQQVFALSIWVRNAKALIGHDEEEAKQQLTEAEKVIRQTQVELTSLIHAFRPVALEDKGLAQALREYVQTWQKQTGIPATLEVSGRHEISPFMEEAFFRIAQEALTNIARHSQASAAHLRLDVGDVVTLSIGDNGRGFDARQVHSRSVGLSSMRERARAVHARYEIHSAKGEGTTITVWCQQAQVQAVSFEDTSRE